MSSLTPDQLTQVKTVVQSAIEGSGATAGPAAYLKIVADFLAALLWPAVALAAIFTFRESIRRRIEEGGVSGSIGPLKIEIEKLTEASGAQTKAVLNEAAAVQPGNAASRAEDGEEKGGLTKGPAPYEQARAAAVHTAAQQSSQAENVLLQEARKLARDYEELRASMLPGDERTRRMEVVMSKMRTLGLAIFPWRLNLMNSDSPGERLAAIAALQVRPDYEALTWLGDRLRTEKPFVGYHAAVALVQAARSSDAPAHLPALTAAVDHAKIQAASISRQSDRWDQLNDFERVVTVLRQGLAATK